MNSTTHQRIGIFVDAAYLMRGAGEALSHGSVTPKRRDITLDPAKAREMLLREAERIGMSDTLIGWYDGFRTDSPLRAELRHIVAADGFELHVGPLREHRDGWTQKRVDCLIQRDMVRAANQGVRDIMLVAGDEDLVVAVEECRSLGSRVHVYGVDAPRRYTSSPYLRAACDNERMFQRQDVTSAFKLRARAGIGQVAAATVASR